MDSSFREQKGWWRKKWLENYLLILTPRIERNLLVKVCFLRSSYRSYQLQLCLQDCGKCNFLGGCLFYTNHALVCFNSTSEVHCQVPTKSFKSICPSFTSMMDPVSILLSSRYSCVIKAGSLLRKCCFPFLYASEWDGALSPRATDPKWATPPLPTSAPGCLSYFTTTLSQKY